MALWGWDRVSLWRRTANVGPNPSTSPSVGPGMESALQNTWIGGWRGGILERSEVLVPREQNGDQEVQSVAVTWIWADPRL